MEIISSQSGKSAKDALGNGFQPPQPFSLGTAAEEQKESPAAVAQSFIETQLAAKPFIPKMQTTGSSFTPMTDRPVLEAFPPVFDAAKMR